MLTAPSLHTVSPAAIRVTMGGKDFGKNLVPISTRSVMPRPGNFPRDYLIPFRPAPAPLPSPSPNIPAAPGSPVPVASFLPSLQTIIPQAPLTSMMPSTLAPGATSISVTLPGSVTAADQPSAAASTVRDAITAAKSIPTLGWLGILAALALVFRGRAS